MDANPQYQGKKTIQLVLGSFEYAQWLRALLQQDGEHHVHVVNEPDLKLGGIVVVDEESLERFTPILDPHRFVVFIRDGTDNIGRIWDAGIRQVVFEGSSAKSAHLTILAAELKQANRL